MRKVLAPCLSLIIIFFFIYCNKKTYSQFNVYPVQKEIQISPDSSGYISLKVEIPVKNHIYGNPKGPGIGKPTTLKIKNIDNIVFDTPRYLTPEKHFYPNDKNFVWIYENETYIFVPFTVKDTAQAGSYTVQIYFDSLLCDSSSCIPKTAAIDLLIDVGKLYSFKNSEIKSLNDLYLRSAPPEGAETLQEQEMLVKKAISNLNISFKPRYLASDDVTNIIQAIIFGLLAGFILNFMPCVLPVVSIKIMSLIKHAGESKKELVKHSTLFTLGILSTFLILATLGAFLGYSWGALFQKQSFLIIMIAIVFALSLSMLEVYTINIPSFAGKSSSISHQYMDSYIKGFLATLLATPCSGPFLGGTLAWSLAQPPSIIFLIFMCIGIGMSLPYIIITINPKLMKFIPKPGNWLISFERIMSFLLIGTTIYLLGILEKELLVPTLWFLFFIAISFWQYGTLGALHQPKVKRIASIIILICLIISGYLISFKLLAGTGNELIGFNEKSFSVKKILNNRDNNKISIVKFTADWCPNCKLVEATSLHTAEVMKAIEKNNTDLFIADLTRRNFEAEALLKQLGSQSIPFLAVFPPGQDFTKPICLRDIYSEKDVLNAIATITKGASKDGAM